MEKKKISGLALLTIMIAMSMMISLAKATNWVEVTSFTGSGTEQYTTDYFTCDHVEWRIRWEYVDSEYTVFNVYTYPQGEDVLFINSIIKIGGEDTSGVSYIHNQQGTFYMKINVANTESYTIIIEQDTDSIPEFTPFALIVVLITVSILAVALSKKFKKRN